MKVAIIGTRGYPYVYGGFETFVRELSERLVKRDVEVHVYCQRNLFKDRPAMVNGIHLHYIPTLPGKSLNQIVHCLLSLFHVAVSAADIVLVLNLAAGPMGWIPKLSGKKTMINTDGMEWLRPKWKGLGAKYFYFGAWCATKLYDKIITDADEMQKVYIKEFNAPSTVIAYGAPPFNPVSPDLLKDLGLEKGAYYLIIGRLVPDNNADLLIRGFLASSSARKLVIVGDVPYQDSYAQNLKNLGSERLIFTGYVRDQTVLMSLYQHCFIYLHGHQFGGTNPAMLKAMSNQCAILALDTSFNREMLNDGEFGMFFEQSSASLAKKIDDIEEAPDQLNDLRQKVQTGLGQKYNWDSITGQYISEFARLMTPDK
ncbi:MAG: DUF1972 domain-containing protein [Daejeonella sp.]|uniref:DUF1972 domain-containing protein n=1 Tax=Daejeonella sp. JGW-45 TaxID=3034148 RepID=UPI0023EB61B3|nr:DUF1972 domain-containing protein [Daejeonella sp. JGW-45]